MADVQVRDAPEEAGSMDTNTVGFFYQAYRNRRAVEFVLENCRKHFPSSPIFLCSDGGLDFAAIELHGGCSYHYYPETIGGSVSKPIDYWKYMERLKVALAFDVDWIVLLEDDVYVRKPIQYWPIEDAAGPIGMEWTDSFKRLLIKQSKQSRPGYNITNFHYGNCGGSIIRRMAMLTALDCMDKALWEEAHEADTRFGNYPDASITGTLQLFGYGYETWLEHSEESCGIFSPIGLTAFDHQYKKFY